MKHLPNLLTMANAASGVVALFFIATQNGTGVAAALIASAIFDGLDGWVARKVGSSGELGKQLDSLADAIAFGATAGFLWNNILADFAGIPQPFSIILGSFVAAASVMRLARFNLDPSQKIDFKGMPTPSNALFALGLWAWLNKWDQWQWVLSLEGIEKLVFQVVAILLLGLSVYWLNASFKVLSLKEDKSDSKRTWLQRAAVIIFLALLPFVGALSISIVVLLLPVLGMLHRPTKVVNT